MTKSWLASYSLPRPGATAMASDASGAVVAYGTAIYRYGGDFTAESPAGTTTSSVQSLFLDGNLVIAVHPQGTSGRTTIFDRTTGATLSLANSSVRSISGASHAPLSNRLYGRNLRGAQPNIVTGTYSDAGLVSGAKESPYINVYPDATNTWVFPDEGRVVDSSGTVYTAPGLNYFGSFGGGVTDIAFNGDVPVVLRTGELIAFTPSLQETGRGAVGVATGTKLYVTASEAFVFSPTTGDPAVNVVALSAIHAQPPGTLLDPDELAYTIDQAFSDKDGNLLLFSKAQMSFFRWSPTSRQYTASIPLAGVPGLATYSKENHSAYSAYDTQAVRVMDLAAAKPTEAAFFTLPGQPNALEAAGELIFTADLSKTSGVHSVYSPEGAQIFTRSGSYSQTWQWDPVKRRMYHFRSNTSPSDLVYDSIDATGKIISTVESPYHTDIAVTPPIRVSPDGSRVVLGNGTVFETEGLTKTAFLTNSFSDAAWSGGKLVTLRLLDGATQLQTWQGDQFLAGITRQLGGTPVRLFDTPAGLVVITSVEGVPRFTLFDSAFGTVYASPARPSAPAGLVASGRTENSVTLQWQDKSDNETGFRVEYRAGPGSWLAGATVGAGATSAMVTGLAAGTTHEFRVEATNGTLASTPSAVATGKTLLSPSEPAGEPYQLRVISAYHDSITLGWQDNANNETGFVIYRSTTPTGAATMLTAPAGSVTFTDNGLAANTIYYYRVQAVNDTVAGDLSTQINRRTLTGVTAPSAPVSLTAVAQGPQAVVLSWSDNSTNEDEFIIERSGNPVTQWTEIGRVGFNLRGFTDSTVSPDTGYSYRVKSSNVTAATASSIVTVKLPKVGGEFAGYSIRSGDVYYFAFKSPDRIERYDLLSRSWLAPVPLQAPATALWVDESGIFVAEDRAVVRYGLDGGSLTPMAGAEYRVSGLFTLGDTLTLHAGGSYFSIDKNTAAPLATFKYENGGGGFSVSPADRRIYFRTVNSSQLMMRSFAIGTDGNLIANSGSAYYNSDNQAGTRTFPFPDGQRVADDSGTVCSTGTLNYNNNLGGPFTDLSFHGADVPILLRNNKLLSCNNSLLESGSFTLSAPGLRVTVSGTDAVVFSVDGSAASGLRVQAVPLSDIKPQVPGPAVDPRGLAYTPDDVLVDKNGTVMLFSKSHQSLFRWSPAQLKYISTLPLLGSPAFAGYSPENHHVYFAYSEQIVREMDLAAANPVETPLFNLPAVPRGFTLAGSFPYVADGIRFMSFSPSGASIPSETPQYYPTYFYGNLNVWDPVYRRVYHFRDGTSPNDLHYESISAAGVITGGGETPYHQEFSVIKPIRVSPDGSKVVIGSGNVFNAADLTKAASLANGFTDAAWFGGQLVTARLNNNVTQLQTWSGAQFTAGTTVRETNGTPLRLLALDSTRLLLIGLVGGEPRFTLFNTALDPVFASPTSPLAPSALAVTDRTTSSVSLHWQDQSDNEDGFQIDYRPAGGNWITGGSAGANATEATVVGLAAGTGFDFRVAAILGDLSSAPSPAVSATTLSDPNQPIGEPYGLRVTRIFDHSVTLEWSDNAANDTGFRVFQSTSATGPATEFDMPAGATTFTSTGLAAGTPYFFRVQVMNGALAGDLSAQVSATTLATNPAPAAPSNLVVTGKTATSVSLTWKDNSTNEETFQIERAVSSSPTWTEVGSVPYDTNAFTDSSALPNSSYSYRVKATNATGSTLSNIAYVYVPKVAGDFAGRSMRAGDVYYFVFTGPNRIERYDLAAREWLASIPLQAAAAALWVDESGIFVAEDRAVIRFALDGSARTSLGNGEATVSSLFTLNQFLVFGPTSGGDLTSINKLTGTFNATLSDMFWSLGGYGHSVAPSLNRVYYRTGGSPTDIRYIEIGSDGKFIKTADSPYHNNFPTANRTFVFPDGTRVADDSGVVYSTGDLSYNNNYGGPFTDLSFRDTSGSIVLRNDKLLACDNGLLEAGSFTLDAAGLRVAVAGTDAVVFFEDFVNDRGLRVQAVPLSSILPVVAGPPVDPHGLAFTPDDVFVDKDGNLLLFTKSQSSLFRWSSSRLDYLPSLPLAGAPGFAGYSKQNHRAYFAYDNQIVREINLADSQPVEKPLLNLPKPPRGFTLAGEFPYVAVEGGLMTYTAGGQLLTRTIPNYDVGTQNTWEPVKRRVYHFRGLSSPSYVTYDSIGANGQVTGQFDNHMLFDYTLLKPLRVNADGSKVVAGNGAVLETSGMTQVAKLSNTFTDALWRADELLTIRATGGGTQIQRWNASTFAAGADVPAFTGTPLRLMALDSQRSVLITIDRGMPRFYVLNADLSVFYDYQSDGGNPPPPAVEDTPFVWTPEGWPAGPLTLSAPVLPAWLSFTNGTLSGTPREADSGDQENRSKVHRILLRSVDSMNVVVDREFFLTVAWRNDAPTIAAPPPVTVNGRAEDSQIDLGIRMTDPDGNDPHLWELTGNTNPSIFSSIGLDQNGRLHLSHPPYVSGSSTVRVLVTDASGASASASFEIILPQQQVPSVKVDSAIRLNRATGLYEQKVTVKNISDRAIAGFDLNVSGLRKGVSLYNATRKYKGGGVYSYRKSIAAGQSIAVTLKYYAAKRGKAPTPVISASLYSPPEPVAKPIFSRTSASNALPAARAVPNGSLLGNESATSATAVPFAITGIHRNPDGSVEIEFPSESGKNYRMQYSADAVHWNSCPVSIAGDGSIKTWTDHGPPSTASPPASVSRRFYRVERFDP